MKYKLHYGDGVLNLPSSVLSRLSDVDATTLKVLLLVSGGGNLSREKMAQEIGCDTDAIADALGYWRGAGLLISSTGGEKKAGAPVEVIEQSPGADKPTTKVADSAAAVTPAPSTLPRYTTEELVALLENRRELAALVDECTRILGKVFSTHETSILLGIVDYLNVDSEYLLLLLAHCAKMGKKSVRYAEKLAFSLYDEGITTPDALQECLKQKEELQEVEGKLRSLFGISTRALTTKERKMINTWLFTFHYGLDVITRAYEITADAIGKASIPYANSILERWDAAGLRTLKQIDQAEQERAAAPKNPTAPGNSFDTDDFFAAALKRSFGDDFELEKKK
ncbi:MAG: DnaD domain protein [Ruminococcaceae bacterium]|nr:DnaD domain protein [Oscillospiraceae bacterium]